ncbi:parapinopsin [Hydra vulgaris]|uniref:Opsin n=1 Tax=Hydra vulgaris TaxID=6087 RepID=A0A857GWT6_HYDVU|nr:parapinopsin-like [Hydra vulgaris]QHF16574.1 opsin [Hydra vulgaris]
MAAPVIGLLSFLCGLSVSLNVTVVVTIISKKNTKDMRDIIIMSLAICDGVECTLGYPVELYGYANIDSPSQNEYLCKTNGFIVMYLALTALTHLVFLCVHRYLVIVHPMKVQKFFTDTKTCALYFIIPSWIYGLFWSITPLIGWSEIVREKEDTHRCTINMYPDDLLKRSYLYALTLFCYFLPAAIIIYCITKVHFELRNMLKLCKQISGEDAAITRATYKLERQNFLSVSLIITSFFLIWTPYTICVCYLILGRELPVGILTYSALFAKSSTILNPIIYCIMYKEFRQTVRSKVRKLFRGPTVAPITE